jgi:prolyl-tRNA synthetase
VGIYIFSLPGKIAKSYKKPISSCDKIPTPPQDSIIVVLFLSEFVMRLSQYFIPTLKETPAEAQIVSHRLMLRAGMIKQMSAGIYAWLPLGLAVLSKIAQIVREEQNRFGAIELLMPTLQSADLWRESGRYDAYGAEMLRLQDRHGRDLLYGPTNEEMITDIFRSAIKSYRDLPKNFYHIQWKFRDEVRPRFGVMRGREFLMKDAYSFDLDEAGAKKSYYRMFAAYLSTFSRLGLKAIPVRADTGPIGGNLSHEFHILADTGESRVYCEEALISSDILPHGLSIEDDLEGFFTKITQYYAAADELHLPEKCPIAPDRLLTRRGIEVGHIFYFGNKYSKAMQTMVRGPDGGEHYPEMGSYGIGVSRLLGAIIEANHDQAGIIWPEAVAPFKVGLITLRPDDPAVSKMCERLYEGLRARNVTVLYDDRPELRPGARFADMDLIGLPWQVVVGPKGLEQGVVELKQRAGGNRKDVSPEALMQMLAVP